MNLPSVALPADQPQELGVRHPVADFGFVGDRVHQFEHGARRQIVELLG